MLLLANILFSFTVMACPGKAHKAADAAAADKTAAVQSLMAATQAQPNNCVNPGGGCNGSVPCCDPNNNFCVRNTCQPVPQN